MHNYFNRNFKFIQKEILIQFNSKLTTACVFKSINNKTLMGMELNFNDK